MACLRVLKCLESYDKGDHMRVWVKNCRDLIVIDSASENFGSPTILLYGDKLCDFIRFNVYGVYGK